jgi:hypothetical protein
LGSYTPCEHYWWTYGGYRYTRFTLVNGSGVAHCAGDWDGSTINNTNCTTGQYAYSYCFYDPGNVQDWGENETTTSHHYTLQAYNDC